MEAGLEAMGVYNEDKLILKLSDFCLIFMAEVLSIYRALDIKKQNNVTNSITHSDSFSTQISIQNYYQLNSISQKNQNHISSLKANIETITMIWISSHIGISGNESADTYAKQVI